jgi:hypothetical protein
MSGICSMMVADDDVEGIRARDILHVRSNWHR